MTTAYTSLLGLALPVTGELDGTWGDVVNNSITTLLDSAIAGTTTISTDADVTLTTTTGSANQAREAILLWTANGTTTRNITAPAQSKIYTVINASAGTQSIVLRGAGPTTGVTIVKGESAVCAWNGSDFIKISNTSGAGVFTSVTDSGLTSGRVTYASTGGLLVDSANLTFNGTTLTAAGLSSTGNTTLGDAAADTVTVNGTITSNLIFTDNTYDIGASGATRPRTLYLGTSLITPSITNSGLTSGRITYATTAGLLTDSASLTYDGSNIMGLGSFTRSANNIGATLELGSAPGNAVQGQGVNDLELYANVYYNSGQKFSASGRANALYVGAGTGKFSFLASTASGAAGGTITWTSLGELSNNLTSGVTNLALDSIGTGTQYGSLITFKANANSCGWVGTTGALTGDTANQDFGVQSNTGKKLHLLTNNSTTPTMSLSGTNVGIGQTGPSYALEIALNPATASSPSIVINPTTGTNGSSIYMNNLGNGSLLIGRSSSAGTGSGTTLGSYDSYIWNTGVQAIEIGTNNTRAMQIDSAQRVGINSPSVSGYQLYVLGASNNAAGRFTGSGNVGGTGSSAGGILMTYDASATGSNTSFGGIRLASSPGADFCLWKISVNTAPRFAIGIDSITTLMQMDTSGYVGWGSAVSPNSTVPYTFRMDSVGAGTPKMLIYPVTTTQSSIINLDNAGSGTLVFGRSSSTGTGSGATLGAYDTFFWNTSTTRIYFGTNNTSAGFIDSGQDWNFASDILVAESVCIAGASKTVTAGVNTVGPTSTSVTTNTGGIYQSGYSSSAGLPYYGGNWASSGNWGFGVDTGTSDNTLRMGVISFTGGGMYWTGSYSYLKAYITPPSDHRLKENVVDFDVDVYSLIDEFRPVYYNIIPHVVEGETPTPSPREIGLIAHEAQAVIGELVRGEKDAVDEHGNMVTQSMFYDRTGVVAIRMLQQFKEKFEALKADFEEYKSTHP